MYYPVYHVIHIEKLEKLIDNCKHADTVRKFTRTLANGDRAGTTFFHVSDMDMTNLLK